MLSITGSPSRVMSEAVPAPDPSQRPHLSLARVRPSGLNSLEALERGFALFRSTFAREAWRYYLGAAPLVVCFIPMWVANGQIRSSNRALLAESVMLAAGYLLRVWLVGSYMQHVRASAFNSPIPTCKGRATKTANVARVLVWKFILGAAALLTLPSVAGASWFYSACQFASLEAHDESSERRSVTGCLTLAKKWFGGGLLLFVMMIPLWISVWINGLILAMVLPRLLHSIFGVNTLLSTEMGIDALIQSSAFWLSLFAVAWLTLDPIVKCTFVVVYQHLRSRREGDDLRGLMASLPREQQKKADMIAVQAAAGRKMTGALFVLGTILLSVSLTPPARAAQLPSPQSPANNSGTAAGEARVRTLRQALDQESQRAVYRWHDSEHPSPPSWFDKLLTKIGDAIGRTWNWFSNLFSKLWPRGLNLSLGSGNGSGWQLKDLRLWLALVAIVTLAAGAVLFWLRRRRAPATVSVPLEVAALPDLNDIERAIERSEDEWFALANRLQGEGELRFAIRAAYLGLLAGLAQREWLTIRRDRTNREYLHEFNRRWLRRPQAAIEVRAEVPDKLRGSLREFDRVWYGFHPVTPDAVTAYRLDQREFLNHV